MIPAVRGRERGSVDREGERGGVSGSTHVERGRRVGAHIDR